MARGCFSTDPTFSSLVCGAGCLTTSAIFIWDVVCGLSLTFRSLILGVGFVSVALLTSLTLTELKSETF